MKEDPKKEEGTVTKSDTFEVKVKEERNASVCPIFNGEGKGSGRNQG